MNSLQEELTCKPLDTYEEILLFLENPPPWRTLCKELTPHSKTLIKNIDINKNTDSSVEEPETFCHFNSDADEVERHDEKKLPKTLVCHDMANGYHDDSIIDGTGQYDAYTFYNWAGIDIFCYFSHHLITIPPLGWINVGHAHGVKVIGTVITEWSDGEAFWHKVLHSEATRQHFASSLVAIAKTLKFDGWLLNVENKIAKPDALLQFVRQLHLALHAELPAAVLLWYDSVTVRGDLHWQNGLTDLNQAFFDACDGIFTNYSWSVADVARSAARAARGGRRAHLFVGLDVWGRNFHGGGQFNTHQAARVAWQHGCSMAVFAPAWSHEALPGAAGAAAAGAGASAGELDRHHQFTLRDRALWGSMWPLLNTRAPAGLPFHSSFCRGQGLKRRMYGEVLCPVPWYNLRHMQYQPNSAHGPHGYLLTTSNKLHNITRQGLYKDSEGIVRYRESFLKHRTDELPSVESKEASVETPFDGVIELTEQKIEDQDNEIEETERPNIKQKIKNALKHMVEKKSEKADDGKEQDINVDEPGPSLDADPPTVVLSTDASPGPKMGKKRYELVYIPDELECLQVYLDDSFIGGSCLKIHPSDDTSPEHRLIRLFHCDFHFEDRLVACVVTKKVVGFEEQHLNVRLFVRNGEGNSLRVVLVGRSPDQDRVADEDQADQEGGEEMNVYPLNSSSDPVFRDLQKYLLLNESGFYVPVENSYGWVVRYYQLPLSGCRVRGVSLRTALGRGPILLGHFGLCHRIDKPD